MNAETKCLYTQTPIVSLHAVIQILLMSKLASLENHETTSLTELEKEDDEDDDDNDDDNDPDGLETSAWSYRTRYRIYCMSLIMTCW